MTRWMDGYWQQNTYIKTDTVFYKDVSFRFENERSWKFKVHKDVIISFINVKFSLIYIYIFNPTSNKMHVSNLNSIRWFKGRQFCQTCWIWAHHTSDVKALKLSNFLMELTTLKKIPALKWLMKWPLYPKCYK